MEAQSQRWSGRIIGIGIVLIVAVMILQATMTYFSSQTTPLYVGNGVFKARVANTDRSRVKGLSGTDPLKSDQAMLFIFDSDSMWGIWMKDMNYPLDIVWLDHSKTVIDYALNVSPNTYPRVYTPKSAARYVIELPSGTVKKDDIRIGRPASFTSPTRKT